MAFFLPTYMSSQPMLARMLLPSTFSGLGKKSTIIGGYIQKVQGQSLCSRCRSTFQQNRMLPCNKRLSYVLLRSSVHARKITGHQSMTWSCIKHSKRLSVNRTGFLLPNSHSDTKAVQSLPISGTPTSNFHVGSSQNVDILKSISEARDSSTSSYQQHQQVRNQGTFQSAKETTFSTTKLILESSPNSLQPYLRLIRFDKPIGTWLLYWPCTWSIALAAQPGCMPDWKMLALFGAGAFFMRGAGCIINDMWDKDFDKKVARTRSRPLASGELTYFQAFVCLGTQLTCALAVLLQLNTYSILLGAASMGLVITYPLCKRFTYWPQIMLGLTLNWGVLLAWSALRGSLELPGLILYLACTLYTIVYDTIYSHQDKYDDMLIGVKSTAIRLGDKTKPWMLAFTTGMAGGLTTTGLMCDMTWPYFTALGLTTARLVHQIYTVELESPDDCAKAFRGNFYLGAVMFLGIIFANILKSKEDAKKKMAEASEV